MQASVPEQLRGVARVLREVVAPAVADAYAADILQGAVATIDMLADASGDVTAFLLWDIEASTALLGAIGLTVATDVDIELARRHTLVRAQLEEAMPQIRANPEAAAAAAAHFRARAKKYPFAARYRKAADAQSSR